MVTRSFSFRILALTAAYALVLHSLLAGMASAHLSGDASLANAVICSGAPGAPGAPNADQPSAPDNGDHSDCVLHCLFAGSAMDAWMPAPSGLASFYAPAANRVLSLHPIETLGRDTAKNPQIPRAPPLA